MGGPVVAAGEEILNRAGIPTFLFPDAAAHAFNYMWKYSYNLKGLYETPSLAMDEEHQADRSAAASIIAAVRNSGRDILTEYESKKLLEAYGIPTVRTEIARSQDEAAKLAGEMGYPVVLKLHSETITHKTDVGGVQLNLRDADAVRKAYKAIETSVAEKAGKGHFLGVTVQPMAKLEGYEVIIGSSIDPQFGPVLLFGSGGQLVEVYKDRALALPPLNSTLARRMMESTKIYKALKGVRGRKPVDMNALESLLVAFSHLVVEQPWIKEIDINPLLASSDRLLALDARVVVYDKKTKEESLPKPAIRPYPVQYLSDWKMKDGAAVRIRPIRPEDEPLMIGFHEHLSDRSVYFRYFQPLQLAQRTLHERLLHMCFIDYDREIALVAKRPGTGGELLAIARMSKVHGTNSAELSLIVRDDVQRQGIGTELVRRMIDVARAEKLGKLVANTLAENVEMQGLCGKLGFKLSPKEKFIQGELAL
jgi:acetyltransferase